MNRFNTSALFTFVACLFLLSGPAPVLAQDSCRACVLDHSSICADECELGFWGEKDTACASRCSASKCKSECVDPDASKDVVKEAAKDEAPTIAPAAPEAAEEKHD